MRAIILSTIISTLLAVGLGAQPFSIDWFKTAGGGRTSSGGQYSIASTAGQQDAAGPMSGGQFSLNSGFWALVALVQTPGAPMLRIDRVNATTLKVSWPSPSSGWVLQQSSNASSGWTPSGLGVSDDGTWRSVLVSPPTGNQFFRLNHP